MIGLEYAKSLFEVHPDLEKALDEFNAFISFYDELLPIMKSPGITSEDKHEIIKKSFKNFSDEFIFFIYVVIDNNRFSNINEIYNEFKKLANEKNNIASCDVYTSNKLSASEIKEVTKYLENELKKKIVINEIIDKNINGIKIIALGKTIDYSLETRINNMRFSI